MNLTTSTDNQIFGNIQCPGDKSISQRVLILGAFINQDMAIDGFLHAEDPLSTMSALNQIGASISVDENDRVFEDESWRYRFDDFYVSKGVSISLNRFERIKAVE